MCNALDIAGILATHISIVASHDYYNDGGDDAVAGVDGSDAYAKDGDASDAGSDGLHDSAADAAADARSAHVDASDDDDGDADDDACLRGRKVAEAARGKRVEEEGGKRGDHR